MPVFRVEKNKDYTVMANFHLRDKSLSLKAKGLLSQMLSLPEDWDYTLSGLCYINRESKDAIRSAVNELERAGYIERHQTTDKGGKFSSNEYIIHEHPVSLSPSSDKPLSENPTTENPATVKPATVNPTQLNKDRVTKDQAITDRSSTHSFPSLSHPPAETAGAVAASPPERKGTEAATQSAVEIFRDIIKKNIEYDHLLRYSQIDLEELDGIVELLVETVCTARKTIRVKEFGHSGVAYQSAALGRCTLHEMNFTNGNQITTGFCGTKGGGMGTSLQGQSSLVRCSMF